MAEAGWKPKREAKQFEPPPWEREQFEVLRQQGRPAEPEQDVEPAEPVAAEGARAETPAPEAVRTDAPAAADVAQAADPATVPPKPAVLEAQVDAMLIQLRGEEPRVDEHLKAVGVFGSAVAMFFGVCMLAWGGYAFVTARGQVAAVIGALIVLAMGGVFGGLGLWFGWRVTNRGE